MEVQPPPSSRQEWLDRFERVAAQQELTEELVSVVELLKLPLSTILAVQEVLKQGNWAAAEHPAAYVKKAAMTQARNDDALEYGASPLVFLGGKKLDECTTREAIKAALHYDEREHGTRRSSRLKGKHLVSAQFAPDFAVLMREWEAAEENAWSWPEDCVTVPQVPESLLAAMKRFHEANPGEYLVVEGPPPIRDWRKLGGESRA